MYELTQNLETVVNTTSSLGKDWYYEVNRYSKKLLITVGDSWTYGDSLDPSKRTKQIYGAKLSKKINYNWINIGLPGESNLVIKQYLSEVINNLKHTYDDVIVIFTLTESTRDLASLNFCEQSYNSIKADDWPCFDNLNNNHIVFLENELHGLHILDVIKLHIALQSCYSLRSTIETIENTTVNSIKKLLTDKSTKLILARNFTSWSNSSNSDVSETWAQVIAKYGNLSLYPKDLYFITSFSGSERLVAYQNKFKRIENFKFDLVEQMTKAQNAITWLIKSPYNSNKATKHPLEKAHEWWADYLYYYI